MREAAWRGTAGWWRWRDGGRVWQRCLETTGRKRRLRKGHTRPPIPRGRRREATGSSWPRTAGPWRPAPRRPWRPRAAAGAQKARPHLGGPPTHRPAAAQAAVRRPARTEVPACALLAREPALHWQALARAREMRRLAQPSAGNADESATLMAAPGPLPRPLTGRGPRPSPRPSPRPPTKPRARPPARPPRSPPRPRPVEERGGVGMGGNV